MASDDLERRGNWKRMDGARVALTCTKCGYVYALCNNSVIRI
jgi:hypothetical protein